MKKSEYNFVLKLLGILLLCFAVFEYHFIFCVSSITISNIPNCCVVAAVVLLLLLCCCCCCVVAAVGGDPPNGLCSAVKTS